MRRRYLEAVRDSVTGVHLLTPTILPHTDSAGAKPHPHNSSFRMKGMDWPQFGLTMIGVEKTNCLWDLLERVLNQDIPGSFVECGVWRGGASIFAKAVLAAHGSDREVHLVDSFDGLPPNTTTRDDATWSKMDYLRVSQEEVTAGFRRFGLLDDRVVFHKVRGGAGAAADGDCPFGASFMRHEAAPAYLSQGFFRYSLAKWREEGIGPIAVLRMDGGGRAVIWACLDAPRSVQA